MMMLDMESWEERKRERERWRVNKRFGTLDAGENGSSGTNGSCIPIALIDEVKIRFSR